MHVRFIQHITLLLPIFLTDIEDITTEVNDAVHFITLMRPLWFQWFPVIVLRFFPSRKSRSKRSGKSAVFSIACGGKGLAKKIVPLRKIMNGVVFSRWLTSSTSITQMVQQTIIMRPETTIGRRRIASRPRYCSYIMF